MAQKDETSGKKKRGETIRQVIRVFKFTYRYDKMLPWFMGIVFLLPIAVAVVVCALWMNSVANWIMFCILGIMVGFLLATIVLTRRSDTVGYKQLEGKPGAAGSIVTSINKGGFNFPQEPVWVDPKTKDSVWRGTGYAGVYLIGDGNPGRVRAAMEREEIKIHRVTPGSTIPIIKLVVGNGKDLVPISKLRNKVMRQKRALIKPQLEQLNGRLRSISQAGPGIPKGIDPNKVKVNRRALRGK
jgi:hypothetical protein